MSRKAKVIDVEPVGTQPAEMKAKTPGKVIDLDAADARRAAERADKTPAVAASKSIEPSPYQVGHDDGYKSGFNDGHSRAILSFVATVEKN